MPRRPTRLNCVFPARLAATGMRKRHTPSSLRRAGKVFVTFFRQSVQAGEQHGLPACHWYGIFRSITVNSFHLALIRERSASGCHYQGDVGQANKGQGANPLIGQSGPAKSLKHVFSLLFKAGFITLRGLKTSIKAHLSYLWATKSELPRLSEWNSATSAYGGK
jgi:hypothetical protein